MLGPFRQSLWTYGWTQQNWNDWYFYVCIYIQVLKSSFSYIIFDSDNF